MDDIKSKIANYCRYQERSHQEVRDKLYGMGLYSTQVEEMIATMISEDLLNEERYARAITRGKHNLLNWGRRKIIYALRQQKVSEFCIAAGLKELDESNYLAALTRLAKRKWAEKVKGGSIRTRKASVYQYLIAKGYESDLIHGVLDELTDND
jgi:regulatory protein